MNFLLKIVIVALITLNVACSSGDSYYDDQSSSIVSFLEDTHDPNLIPYKDVASSIDKDPEFYTTFVNSSYRYIRDYYSSDREDKSEVLSNSTITITFWLYDFSSYSSIDEYTTEPLYTNDSSLEDALIESGLNTTYWDFSPLTVKLSDGDSIIIGAREALIGCKEGDFVEIYMTYNTAYDDNVIGVVEQTTPMAMFCRIDSIE